MTTVAALRMITPATPVARIWAVVKLNLTNPWTAIILPSIIFGIIFLADLVIRVLINSAAPTSAAGADRVEGYSMSGGTVFIFVYMLVAAVQIINLTFQYAVGYGVTRRDFYLGSSLTFLLLSLMYSIGLTTLAEIERATNGWGLGGRMFAPLLFGDGQWFERLWIFFTVFLFFFFVGAVTAAVYVRWKSNGVVAMFTAIAALVIAGAALLTFTENWPAFVDFFLVIQHLGGYSLSLVISLIAAVCGYFVLRGATPTN